MEAYLSRSRRFGQQLAVGKSKNHVEWTYDQLWLAVDSIRSVLRTRVKQGQAVAILGQRSGWAYASALAALCEGCYFVPINPKWPLARRDKVLKSVSAQILLYEERYEPLADGLAKPIAINIQAINPVKSEVEIPSFDLNSLAYVLFTSGSTGEPKGIAVSRGNISAFLQSMKHLFPFEHGERFTQSYDLSFDLGVGEVLWALTSGGSLHPLESVDLAFVDKYLEAEKVTIWSSTPSMVEFLAANKILSSVSASTIKASLFCGEKLSANTANLWASKAPESAIYNLYGPTEATIYVTCHKWTREEVDSQGGIPIGTPFPGTQIQLIDENMRPVPSGERGEVIITGPQVAIGYWQDDLGTRRSFVSWSGRRWYKTGDIALVNPKGNFEFIGRRDDQVKLNGHRLELGEVEAVARSVFSDSAVAAVLIENAQGVRELVLAINGVYHEKSEEAVKAKLKSDLPAYAQPSRLVFLMEWPLSNHGKLDRVKLGELIQRMG